MLLPSRNIFYDPYYKDEDFYNELAELIKTKMENTGLDVIDCEVSYDSNEEKGINIKFKNPVYKQYAQSNR